MTMTCKINKLEKPGGPQGNFHALFGRSAAIYGHFRADAVTSERSTRISLSLVLKKVQRVIKFDQKTWLKSNSNMNTDLRKGLKSDFEKKTFSSC